MSHICEITYATLRFLCRLREIQTFSQHVSNSRDQQIRKTFYLQNAPPDTDESSLSDPSLNRGKLSAGERKPETSSPAVAPSGCAASNVQLSQMFSLRLISAVPGVRWEEVLLGEWLFV